MREKKLLIVIVSIGLLFAQVGISTADESISFDDALGRSILLDKPAERIAFEYNAIGEAIRIIGAWDKVVARDGHSSLSDERLFPNSGRIPAINPENAHMNLDYELIINLQPDVIILQKEDWNIAETKTAIDTLEPDIPVIVLDFLDPLTIPDNLKKLGMVTGNVRESAEVAGFYSGVIGKIQDKTAQLSDSEKPELFFDAPGYSVDHLSTYGKGMEMFSSLLSVAGGKNVAADNCHYQICFCFILIESGGF